MDVCEGNNVLTREVVVNMNNAQKKTLELCRNGDYGKAWAYQKLMGNTFGVFLGEVPASEFITGDALAERIGLTAGTSQHSDTPWLKFLLVHKNYGYGSLCWMQEYQSGQTDYRDRIGQRGVTHHSGYGATFGSADYGWRPVLRLKL